MASDGNWVTAKAQCHTPLDYARLKYYHYCLWTGIYMMDANEARVINLVVLALAAVHGSVVPLGARRGTAVALVPRRASRDAVSLALQNERPAER